MNKSILVIDTPSSCSKCGLMQNYGEAFVCLATSRGKLKIPTLRDGLKKYTKHRHPNCPLISIDIDELEEATSHLEELVESYEENTNFFNQNMRYINTIKSTIDKLKGVE